MKCHPDLFVVLLLSSILLLFPSCSKNESTPSIPPEKRCPSTSSACRTMGKCTKMGGKCVATKDSDCLDSRYCKWKGECTVRNGECIVANTEECRNSTGCVEFGDCHKVDDHCAAKSNVDCKQSKKCKDYGLCRFGVASRPASLIEAMASAPSGTDIIKMKERGEFTKKKCKKLGIECVESPGCVR